MTNVSTTTAAIYQAVLDSLNSSGECGVLPPAPPGKSAYEVAVDNGFVGSEKQWLDTLTIKQEQEIARLEARIVGNEKFTKDSKYAASKLVGTSSGQVPLANQVSSLLGTAATKDIGTGSGQVATWKSGGIENTGVGGIGSDGGPHRYKTRTAFGGGLSMGADAAAHETPAQVGSFNSWHSIFSVLGKAGQKTTQSQFYLFSNRLFFRFRDTANSTIESEWARDAWREVYTDKNTTIGTNREIIKSSPVLRVFKDGIEKIHEANDLDIEFIVNGVGDYTIKGTTGIRDGKEDWTINIPKDNHDNQLIAFTMEEEEGGIVHLKTYKRTFSMETFTFGPDLSTPVDIPDGRWVDMHFNDLPQEELDESELYPEEEPEVVEEEVPAVVEEEEPVEEDPKD